ncbi:hypothetical protein A0H81_02346 [Grifola frondosa]|uniref:Uncharacterized protein n=1 Tax=Grifola frondosa TaxID=5627 RepID=A0A1C7MNU2_GRIFR|nr:hypothetical protein A0H81_02346 [Grifola frondosa]
MYHEKFPAEPYLGVIQDRTSVWYEQPELTTDASHPILPASNAIPEAPPFSLDVHIAPLQDIAQPLLATAPVGYAQSEQWNRCSITSLPQISKVSPATPPNTLQVPANPHWQAAYPPAHSAAYYEPGPSSVGLPSPTGSTSSYASSGSLEELEEAGADGEQCLWDGGCGFPIAVTSAAGINNHLKTHHFRDRHSGVLRWEKDSRGRSHRDAAPLNDVDALPGMLGDTVSSRRRGQTSQGQASCGLTSPLAGTCNTRFLSFGHAFCPRSQALHSRTALFTAG